MTKMNRCKIKKMTKITAVESMLLTVLVAELNHKYIMCISLTYFIYCTVLTFFPPPFFVPSFPSNPWTLVIKPACCKNKLRWIWKVRKIKSVKCVCTNRESRDIKCTDSSFVFASHRDNYNYYWQGSGERPQQFPPPQLRDNILIKSNQLSIFTGTCSLKQAAPREGHKIYSWYTSYPM